MAFDKGKWEYKHTVSFSKNIICDILANRKEQDNII